MIIHKQNKTKWFNRGFTLIELLVVVSIIGMLSSVVLVSVQGARNKAKEIKLLAGINQLKSALELYRLDNNRYPGGPLSAGQAVTDGNWHASSDTCPSATVGHNLDEIFDATFKQKYMPTLPTELVTCGLYYLVFSGSQNATAAVCASPGSPLIYPDGYDKANPAPNSSYAYLIKVTVTGNPSTSAYPVVVWPDDVNAANFTYTPNYNSTERCILGPKL